MEVKDAVIAAKKAANDFFDEEMIGLQLEEVDYDEQSNCWLITLGYNVESLAQPKGLAASLAGYETKYTRKYKVFCIDNESEKVLSMKIRQI